MVPNGALSYKLTLIIRIIMCGLKASIMHKLYYCKYKIWAFLRKKAKYAIGVAYIEVAYIEVSIENTDTWYLVYLALFIPSVTNGYH